MKPPTTPITTAAEEAAMRADISHHAPEFVYQLLDTVAVLREKLRKVKELSGGWGVRDSEPEMLDALKDIHAEVKYVE